MGADRSLQVLDQPLLSLINRTGRQLIIRLACMKEACQNAFSLHCQWWMHRLLKTVAEGCIKSYNWRIHMHSLRIFPRGRPYIWEWGWREHDINVVVPLPQTAAFPLSPRPILLQLDIPECESNSDQFIWFTDIFTALWTIPEPRNHRLATTSRASVTVINYHQLIPRHIVPSSIVNRAVRDQKSPRVEIVCFQYRMETITTVGWTINICLF